jgi:hypothetical protein
VRRIRFTIGALLFLVLFLGVSLAALREAKPIWDAAILSLTITALLVSMLLAVHRDGGKRAFWLGFALVGSAYLGLTIVPSVEPRLLTTQALAFLDSRIPGRPAPAPVGTWNTSANNGPILFQNAGTSGGAITVGTQQALGFWSASTPAPAAGAGGPSESFMRTGHSLLALIAAWLGGLLSRYLHATGGRTPAEVSERGQAD